MSRKSLIKKQQFSASSWHYCQKCSFNIILKDRDNHDVLCPLSVPALSSSPYAFITDNVFYTTNLEKKLNSEETKDFTDKQLNSLIFISESAMKLCQFYIGQHVVIKNTMSAEAFVRLAWPIQDKLPSLIYVAEKDFEKNWKRHTNAQFNIEKLTSDPVPVEEIFLRLETAAFPIVEENLQDICKILTVQMRDLVFCINNCVVLNFYNKELRFTIIDFKSRLNVEDDRSVESQIENLSIKSDDFLLITHTTKITIQNKTISLKSSELVKEDFKTTKSDIGGLNDVFQIIEENINIVVTGSSNLPTNFKKTRGLLLFGPSGCGKTMICEAIATEFSTKANIIQVNTSEIFSKFLGESEKNLQDYFEKAFNAFPRPAIVIIEDINNLCPKNELNDVIKRVSVAFLSVLDSLHWKQKATRTFVIGTTNSLENLNTGLRRNGRLDQELEIPAPSPLSRQDILVKILNKIKHSLDEVHIKNIAEITHGFVGSDLVSLVYKASIHSLHQGYNTICSENINYALNFVKPSAMREVHIQNPNVKWDDIGGQDDLKLKLKQSIEWPLKHPEKFEQFGITPPRGLLMFGPPGCSKTMIAKALATESQVNFLSIKGPELFSMWVGESERAVREVFRKARQVAPSIIFFDEIDAIGSERSSTGGNSSVKERVLTQMLTELDGVDTLKNVTIVAATNRPDMCDKALLRPGRIDRIIYVGLPDANARKEIFSIKLKKMPIDENIQVEELVRRTEGYSGAEIQAVCHEAALKTLEMNLNAEKVTWAHFENALETVQPRTSKELLEIYKNYISN